MTEQLQSMLREAADDGPDLTLRGDPWRRGRRIRFARRAAGVAGAAVAVTAVVAGTALLTTPDLTSDPEPAQEPVEPALPDTLYEVPPNIADISDDPLGEPAAVVYRGDVHTGIYSDGTRPVVVGAESGEVRAVRDVAPMAETALSPDGTKLAVAAGWRLPSVGGDEADEPPIVYVVDMVTGEAGTHRLPDEGLGGGVRTLAWPSDSSTLAVAAIVTTSIDDDGQGGSGDELYASLDMRTGEWSLGDNLIPGDQGIVVETPDGDLVDVELGDRQGVKLSPDGHQIANVYHPSSSRTSSDLYVLEIFDDRAERIVELDLGEYSSVRLLGFGERGVLVESVRQLSAADGPPDFSTVVERIDVSDPADPERTTIIDDRSHSGRVGVAAAFVDADTRESTPPEAGFDWIRWVPEPFLLLLLGIVAVFVVLQVFWRRRRRARAVPAVAEVEEPPSE